MPPDRWNKIKEIFHAALDLELEAREPFLQQQCGGDGEMQAEVAAMLQSDEEAGRFFEEPVMHPPRPDPMIGRDFGPYRILRRIGRGGMGSVYLAQRADDQFRRRVAVKAVRADLVDENTLRRFQNERQTLAVLDHPNIIKLLDGGTTEDGLPYLVMDYAEGQPIDAYCEHHNLSVHERLELFRTVCAAVHYAHQNLVVHRDLKPGNILVTPEGVAKLLDFGIAKLLKPEYSAHTAGLTRTFMQPMTPEYASPEQIQGRPVTTASDIYSLGVLLYRLLSGQHPYEFKTRSALEFEKAVCEHEPEKPSTMALHLDTARKSGGRESVARALRGDLDNIVLMAMRKEPRRRYPSAEHLAEDIRRHLHDLPVMARKNTLGYRWGKFMGRNKAAVLAGVAALLLVSASGWTARNEYLRATRRFRDLRQFANFAINDLDDAMRQSGTTAREKLVAKGTEYLDSLSREVEQDSALQRELISGYVKMGDVQGNLYSQGGNLGLSKAAGESYRKALSIAEELTKSGQPHADLNWNPARLYEKLGDLAAPSGDRVEALSRYQQSLKIYQPMLAADSGNTKLRLATMNIFSKMGYALGESGDPEGAAESFRHCLELAEQLDPENPNSRAVIALTRQRIAYFSVLNGAPAGAEAIVQETLDSYRKIAGPKPSKPASRSIALWYKTLAEVQKYAGKTAEALESIRRGLRITEELLAADPKNAQLQIDLHQGMVLLIDLLTATGKNAEARTQTERALAFLKPLAAQPDASQYHLQNYAWLLVTTPDRDLQDHEAALRSARKAAALTRDSDPQALDLLVRAYQKVNQRAEALETARKALALLPAIKPGANRSEIRKTLEARLSTLQQ